MYASDRLPPWVLIGSAGLGEPRPALAPPAEPVVLERQQHEPGEVVVDLATSTSAGPSPAAPHRRRATDAPPPDAYTSSGRLTFTYWPWPKPLHRPLRGGEDAHRRLGEVAGAVRRRHHHRAGAVVLEAAVEQVERVGDERDDWWSSSVMGRRASPPAGSGLAYAREAHRDVAEVFGRRAVQVHVAAHHHRVRDRRVEHAERHRERGLGVEQRAGPAQGGRASAPRRRPPGPWPKRWNSPWHRLRYTTTISACPASTASAALATAAHEPPPPGSHDHRRAAQLGQPEVGGQEDGVVAVVGERAEPVDLVQVEPRVGDRGESLPRGRGACSVAPAMPPHFVYGVSPTPTMHARAHCPGAAPPAGATRRLPIAARLAGARSVGMRSLRSLIVTASTAVRSGT